MRRLVARNTSTNQLLADRVGVAATRAERAVGLLSRTSLEPGEALWIVPSRGVHTWGMRFAIDVVALDEAGTVIDCVPNMGPWRLRLPRRQLHRPLHRRGRPRRRSRRPLTPRLPSACRFRSGTGSPSPPVSPPSR